jgi:hypothetical protein
VAVLAFGVMHPNLPHWATARMAEGVRFSRVFDHGVKRWLTELNAGCQGVRRFSQEGLANSYKGWCLVCFRRLERGGYCRLPLQNQWFGFGHLRKVHCICAIICTVRISRSVKCIAVAAVCRTPSGELSLNCSRLTKPVHGRLPPFGHGYGGYLLIQLSNQNANN